VVFVDDIPLGATGKIDKKVLRAQFADYKLGQTRTTAKASAAVAERTARPPSIFARIFARRRTTRP
jgi:fatty-acyl-CoA synthase